MQKLFAVIENNKVVNIVVGVEDDIVAANPEKYVEYTNGWDFENGIETNGYFPLPIIETENDKINRNILPPHLMNSENVD